MNLFQSLKAATAALPAVVIPDRVNTLSAALTGINRFALSGFASYESPRPEDRRLMQAGYVENHYIFTVADWKAQQLALAPPVVYEVKEEKAFRKYSSLQPHQKLDSYALRTKSIAEVESLGDPLVRLLQNPNPSQTWAEYAYAHSVYFDFGNALHYGVRLAGGANKNQIRELYMLPTGVYLGENPTVAGYEFFLDTTGTNQKVLGSDVLHLRRFNPDINHQGSRLWGMSKLTPARKLLAKSANTIDAESESMLNRGSRTIIFPKGLTSDSAPTSEQAAFAGEAMRKKLKQAGSGGIATNSLELGVIQLDMSPVDLNIIQSNAATKEEICALWHVHVLSVFSAMSGATFSNLEEANKASLRGGVLPDLNLLAQKLNSWLVPGYSAAAALPRYIEFNTDVYPELQADRVELFSYLQQVPLTGDELREAAGYSAIGSPDMQIPLVNTTRQPITDFATPGAVNPNNDGTY